jgi:cholesterol oxidase
VILLERLSLPIGEIRSHYTVVVVGSGYGGAINAARIARAGQDVCILERGKELHPGQYPRAGFGALRQAQLHTPTSSYGPATGMFDFHAGHDISILVGCGLGGTSLINANVALEPSRSIFSDRRWPAELRDPTVLQPYMDAARKMLGSNPYPQRSPALPRLGAMQRAGTHLGHQLTRPDINVTFEAGKNIVGVDQNACVLCGNCCTGCNYGAKNTVLMNYLPDAHAHGAHIFSEVAARSVGREGGKWRIVFDVQGDGRRRRESRSGSVTADVVVLAAGTLGSTEILLRSRSLGLRVSDLLGHRFSGNGDALAFAYDTDQTVRGVGVGRRDRRGQAKVGPTITGLIDLRSPDADQRKALIIEDGAIPGALARIAPLVMFLASCLAPGHAKVPVLRRLRELAQVPLGSYRGAMDRTLTYLIMSTDDADGRIVLAGDRAHVEWPGAGREPVFARDTRIAATATDALRGIPVPDPLWAWTKARSVVTVHPIGGCVMADDATQGVVDHLGRVFDPAGGVHEGLYVSDGSVIPLALDANPLLTISALAERTAAKMIEDRNWAAGVARPSSTVVPPPAPSDDTGPLVFSEHVSGFVSTHSPINFQDGFERGRHDGAATELFLTIAYDDVRAVLTDPTVPARISGTVMAPEISRRRMTVVDGQFTLHDPAEGNTWHQRYRMDLVADDGRRFAFDGYKVIPKRGPAYLWDHTTTLYTTIKEQDGPTQAVGILHLTMVDLIKLLRSFDVPGVSPWKRTEYIFDFLKHFAGDLAHVIGGRLHEFHAFPAAPTTAPPIRPPKEPDGIWWCDGNRMWQSGGTIGDDAFLRLTRYQAGDKGPVIMATGFGMSSHSFVAPTVDKNLAEFLAERGYDVWLFDYRAGIDLPSAATQFTIDDIARCDWPLAVKQVRDVTGRDDVQALGHCVGSVSLQMAILDGMRGIRSAVCCQFSMHLTTSIFTMLKSEFRVANLLNRVGIKTVVPDTRRSIRNVLLDGLFRALPMPHKERCDEAVCHWINAIYGCTHHHAQLSDATHRALKHMFGVGNTTALEHLTLMFRKRRAVTHAGDDDYLRHPENIADTKLLLLQGRRNYIFHPAGTRRTLRWLRQHNPRGHYERIVLPDYAHLDAIVGAGAATDVYPRIAEFLDRTQ